MSLVSDFDDVVIKVQVACMAAVEGGLKDGLLKKIAEKAEENVYSYGASGRAMSERRGTIGSEQVMETRSGGGGEHFWVQITNRAYLQNPGGADESDVVEKGYANYKQPGPREFMVDALEDFTGSGESDAILHQYLAMYGVT